MRPSEWPPSWRGFKVIVRTVALLEEMGGSGAAGRKSGQTVGRQTLRKEGE